MLLETTKLMQILNNALRLNAVTIKMHVIMIISVEVELKDAKAKQLLLIM